MSWHRTAVAPGGTHHVLDGGPLYAERFDEVLKFHAPGLASVSRANEAWHIDLAGKPAYSRRFARTFGFYEGRATVIGVDGWHPIDVAGRPVGPERYAWCGNYQGERCPVRTLDGAYLHIDAAGQPAYQSRHRYAGDYRDGIAVVQGEDGLSTHVDTGGRPVHGRRFLDLDVFHKGFARARDMAGWTHVDRTGHPAYTRRFVMVEPFYNGQARVEEAGGGLLIIDSSGSTVAVLRPRGEAP